jgi:hypothetical protein
MNNSNAVLSGLNIMQANGSEIMLQNQAIDKALYSSAIQMAQGTALKASTSFYDNNGGIPVGGVYDGNLPSLTPGGGGTKRPTGVAAHQGSTKNLSSQNTSAIGGVSGLGFVAGPYGQSINP